MEKLKKIFLVIPFFIISYSHSQYLKNYEPINVFLEIQKIDKNKKYILQKDKASNKQALRIFNGGEGPKHITDPKEPADNLFIEKHWKKLYKKYANDTVKKYWKNEDFPGYSFILENKEGLLNYDFHIRYMDSRIDQVIFISEPMYYMNKKYIMFYFSKGYFNNSADLQVVIMKKEKDKWIVVRIIGDYAYY
jgi:hypothetical protein